MFNNKNILITGGTGSFGKKFIEIILKKYKPKKIIVYSRDEQKQYQLQKKWQNKSSYLRFFIGDVRDLDRLKTAVRNVDIVIHAAALKHVTIGEYNPFEVVKTNIIGAQNIIEACMRNNVKKVIALSTDKASSPVNLYGATKLTADKLFVAANYYRGNKNIKFSVVRYGNVMGSRGSVIPFFLGQKNNNFLPITDKRMTRFNITLTEGINFVTLSLKNMWGGEIFIPKIPSYKILDLAKAIAPDCKIKFVGIRPGEKIHEEMISSSESLNTVEFKNYFVICPNSELINWSKKDYIKKNKLGKNCKSEFSYNSKENNKFLKTSDLKKIIKSNLSDIELK
jgi:UDP-N-acetylglucosamine 4,6-dehydratase/5-epimerase